MVSDVAANYETPIKINQDANLYVTEVTPENVSTITIAAKRQAYFLLIEGDGTLALTHLQNQNQETSNLNQYDAAEIFGPCSLDLTPSGSSPVHGLIIEMAYTGHGRQDL